MFFWPLENEHVEVRALPSNGGIMGAYKQIYIHTYIYIYMWPDITTSIAVIIRGGRPHLAYPPKPVQVEFCLGGRRCSWRNHLTGISGFPRPRGGPLLLYAFLGVQYGL